MKTVFFIRHAKSSWEDSSLSDHDRPLNNRGIRDAPFMAKVLNGKGHIPQQIVCSSANRAQSTALYFAKEFDVKVEDVLIRSKIYEAFPEQVMEVIQDLDDEFSQIFIFGHNPAFTSILNNFTDDYIANLPTCGIGRVSSNVDRWSDFAFSNGELKELFYPKQYFD